MIKKIIGFYREGFAGMKLGKTLWLVVIVKLVVIFVVLKLLFFPDIINRRAGGDKAGYVSTQILERAEK